MRPGRRRLPRARVRDVRLGRRLVRRSTSSQRCSGTSPSARSSRWAPRSSAWRSATASRSTTTRRAASAGAAGTATRRCASSSARRRSTRAASPSTCASSRSWSASCCRSTGSTRCSATLDRAARLRAACAGPRRDPPRRQPARRGRRGAAACCRSPPRTPAASTPCGCASPIRTARGGGGLGRDRHGNEPVDVAIVCTRASAGDRRRGPGAGARRLAVLVRAARARGAAAGRGLGGCSRANYVSPRAGRPARPTCGQRWRCSAGGSTRVRRADRAPLRARGDGRRARRPARRRGATRRWWSP